MQNLPATEQTGCTVTRILMDLVACPTSAVAADGLMRVSIGIGEVSEEAFNALVVPDPNVNAEEPVSGWMYKAMKAVQSIVVPDHVHAGVFKEDLRAQRKLGNRSKLVMVTNNDAIEATAFDVVVVGLVRVLLLLP